MLGHCVVEQSLEQDSAFSVSDTPADNFVAENIDDDVEIEIGPFRGPLEFGDVPRPDFIPPHCQKFRWRRRARTSPWVRRMRYMVLIEQ